LGSLEQSNQIKTVSEGANGRPRVIPTSTGPAAQRSKMIEMNNSNSFFNIPSPADNVY